MKLKYIVRLSLALMICTFVLSSSVISATTKASTTSVLDSGSTRLFVDPPSIIDMSLTPGTSFTVDVKVENVFDLYTWSLVLSWDPALLNVTSVVEGPFLAEVAPEGTFFIDKRYQEAGYIDEACSILGPYPGAEGNGTLVTATFLVEQLGETTLDLKDTALIDSKIVHIPHTADDGYFLNTAIIIYTDKYSYSTGDTMHLGLTVINPLDHAITVCIAVWLEEPDGSKTLLLHAHAKTLPAGFRYSNPDFKTFELPSIPPGVYTWHAALLNRSTHKILIEDTAEWEFV